MAGYVWADTQLQSQSLFNFSRRTRGKAALPSGGNIPRFTEVSTAKPRWDFFGASVSLQICLVLALFWIPVLMVRAAPPSVTYNAVPLITAPLTEYIPPAPAPAKKFVQPVEVKRAEIPQPVKPKMVFEPRVVAMKPVRPKAPVEAPSVNEALGPKIEVNAPQPVVRRPVETGVLASTGSSAVPTLTNRPLSQVQTGGFGDPNGVPANGNTNRAANINAKGSFDLPGGPGYGNGTGGAKGARGTVASAGFGNGIAIAAPPQPARRGTVQATGFGDAAPVAATAAKPTQPTAGVARVPVEVISKPNPVYTEEARKLRIEGEVKLRVIFLASGELQIASVTQGLGHGLDEAAIAAAKRIRFRPAREGDRALDQPAIITIEFKLAY